MTSAVDGRTSGLDFSLIVEAFQDMEKTSSRLALIDFLVQLFKKTPNNLIDKVTYLIQGKLHPDYEGIELGIAGKMVMRAIASASGTDQARLDKIYQETGDIGDTASIVLQKKGQTTFFSEPMTVERVYSVFEKIALAAGPGSQESKVKLLQSLLNDATPEEGRYTVKFVLGELRLGIADYTVLDALAIAYTGDKANRPALENAYNVTSDLGSLARGLAEKGLSAATSMQITMFKPVRPMLAERAKTAAEALERSEGAVAVEFKLDGERVQLHKGSDKVEMFSRRLERITSHYPDVASAISDALPSHEAILEGEVVAVDQATHEYLPFQELMHRRRKHGIEEAMSNYPVVINLFDLLYLDGRSTLGLGYSERRSLLERLFSKVANKKIKLVEQIVARKTREIDKFTKRAIQSGCEGIMAKQLESTYRAGAREFAWMKLKKEYQNELADSLDLVIVGALFGRGRRVGSYGALLLAAYDSDKDTFQSISKVGTGFTDADLVKFFSELQSFRISHRHPRVDAELKMDVWFEPKIVIEVIASEITLSPLHTAGRGVVQPDYGLALRFPKFTGKVRDDKKPEDATTVTEVVEMYQQQSKKRPTTSQKAADDS